MRRAILNLGLAALLVSAAASGARADLTSEITFQGTLSNAMFGDTSVSGQFGFDFTTDTVTSYKFTAPGGESFDSTVFNITTSIPFTSSGTPYLEIFFQSAALNSGRGTSQLVLVVNPTITEFFIQHFPIDGVPGASAESVYVCNSFACSSSLDNNPVSAFANGTVSPVPSVPEPDTWAMMLLGFAGLAVLGRKARAGFRL